MKCEFCGTVAVFDINNHCVNCGAPLLFSISKKQKNKLPLKSIIIKDQTGKLISPVMDAIRLIDSKTGMEYIEGVDFIVDYVSKMIYPTEYGAITDMKNVSIKFIKNLSKENYETL